MTPAPEAWVMLASGEARPVHHVAGDWACVLEPLSERAVSVCVAGQTCRAVLEQDGGEARKQEACTKTTTGRECAPCAAGERALLLGPERVSGPDPTLEVRCPAGTRPIEGSPGMCQPALPAPPMPPGPEATEWNPGQRERWILEITAHGFLGVNRFGGAAGGDVAIGVRHLEPFDSEIPFSELGWAAIFVAPVVPLLLVPSGVWVGNEIGADLVVHGISGLGPSHPETSHLLFGLRPILRVTTEEGRFRFPAVLGVLPEMGMGLVKDGGAEFFLGFHPFTIGYLVVPHVAIELDPMASLLMSFDTGGVQGVVGMNLGLVVR